MSIDTEDRISELLHATETEPTNTITADQVLGRASQQRRARLAMAGSITAVALIAGGLGLAALADHSTDSPNVSQNGGLKVPVTPPEILVVTDSGGQFEIVYPTSGAPAKILAGYPHHLNFWAMTPAQGSGGWVTNSATTTRDRAVQVGIDGSVRPFGPVLKDSGILTLAVSPNGNELAMATEPNGPRGDPSLPVRIRVLPMPGHHGPRRTWLLGPQQVNDVISLSWAPDSKRLSYIAGTSTGQGIGGPPATLDVTKPGRTAPVTSTWRNKNHRFDCIDNAMWLSTLNEMGVIDYCHGNNLEYRVVNGSTGAPQAVLRLPVSRGCVVTDLRPLLVGDTAVVTACGRAYFLAGDSARALPGDVLYASPPGNIF